MLNSRRNRAVRSGVDSALSNAENVQDGGRKKKPSVGGAGTYEGLTSRGTPKLDFYCHRSDANCKTQNTEIVPFMGACMPL
jgi:hypothetical protein